MTTVSNSTTPTAIARLFDGVSQDWKDIIGDISSVLEYIDLDRLVPRAEDVFNFARYTPLSSVRVVIVGKDPYPTGANGLAFSSSGKVQASLRRIYKALMASGLISTTPTTGSLIGWAKQGVLLINTSLTLGIDPQSNKATNFNRKLKLATINHSVLWKPVINRIIASLPDAVYILWGNDAKRFAPSVKYSLCWSHPSPLCRIDFTPCTNFIECNTLLAKLGKQPIEWHQLADYTTDMKSTTSHTDMKSTTSHTDTKLDDTTSPTNIPSASHTDVPSNNDTPAICCSDTKDSTPNPSSMSTATDVCDKKNTVYKAVDRKLDIDVGYPQQDHHITVYTDGSCDPNNGSAASIGGWAFVVREGSSVLPTVCYGGLSTDVAYATNNRAEGTAIIHAMEYIEDLMQSNSTVSTSTATLSTSTTHTRRSVTIVTDSMFWIDMLTKYMPGWKKKGTPFESKKNPDLTTTMYTIYTRLGRSVQVDLRHTRSHDATNASAADRDTIEYADYFYNDLADRYAVLGRTATELIKVRCLPS